MVALEANGCENGRPADRIGDSVEHDIAGAKSVVLRACWCCGGILREATDKEIAGRSSGTQLRRISSRRCFAGERAANALARKPAIRYAPAMAVIASHFRHPHLSRIPLEHGPAPAPDELAQSCLAIAEDGLGGQEWCEKNGYPGYTATPRSMICHGVFRCSSSW